MKKLVLLGDSIRLIGYGGRVAELLSDRYETWQSNDNCRWADYTFRMLSNNWNDIKDADVIHWNNGHWDVCELFDDGPFTSEENYVRSIVRVAKRLLTITDKVIFSTTTPVRPQHRSEKDETIRRYNAAVTPVLKELGVTVNDLYSFVYPKMDTYIKEDHVHLSDEGIEAVANQIVGVIKEVDKP